MQKPKTTECPYPVRVTAPEKNAARAESDRVRCGKMLRRLMQLSAGENGTGLSGKTEDLTWMQKRCSGMKSQRKILTRRFPSETAGSGQWFSAAQQTRC